MEALTILDVWSYQYDAVGNRTSKTDMSGKAETYNYDEVDRLTRATYADGELEAFSYDAVGNRKTRTDEAANVTTYSYDIANQLLSVGTVTFTYDANGSTLTKTTSRGTTTFTYDFNNRLKTISGPDGSESNQYAPDGIRTQAAGTAFENQTRGIIYDLIGNPIIDTLAGWNPAWIYRVYGPGIDEPLGEWRNNGNRKTYLHHDALGSVTLVSDSTGGASYRSTYRAFGEMIRTSDPSGTPTRLGYTSREISSGSLINYRSRYYDSSLGRFLRRDKYRGDDVAPASLHAYVYVKNNAARYSDPFGKRAWEMSYIDISSSTPTLPISFAGGIVMWWAVPTDAAPGEDAAIAAGFTFWGGASVGRWFFAGTFSSMPVNQPDLFSVYDGWDGGTAYASASLVAIWGQGVTALLIGIERPVSQQILAATDIGTLSGRAGWGFGIGVAAGAGYTISY